MGMNQMLVLTNLSGGSPFQGFGGVCHEVDDVWILVEGFPWPMVSGGQGER